LGFQVSGVGEDFRDCIVGLRVSKEIVGLRVSKETGIESFGVCIELRC
jgi:hypothetical protein